VNLSTARPWLGTVARLILGVLFFWSGVVKLEDPRAFLRGVLAYELTWNWLGKAIAYGLPVFEMCIGALLVLGLLTRIAAIVGAVAQLIFLIAIIAAPARGIKLDCGCFTTGGVAVHSSIYVLVALLNVALIGLALMLYRWPLTPISVDQFVRRSDYVVVPSAKRLRNDQGRRKYEAEVAAKERIALIRHRYLLLGIVLPVVLITFIAIGVQANRAKVDGRNSTNGSYINGISTGVLSSITVDVFEDFGSPQSLAFEQRVGSLLDSLAKGGKTQVRFHMVAIYDRNSNGNRYSSRAANAGVCASEVNNLNFLQFHRYLFGRDGSGSYVMPPVGGHGRTDSSLITYATAAFKLSAADQTTYSSCVQGDLNEPFVLGATNNFTNRGFNNVPVVLVNGKRLTSLTVAALTKATAGAKALPPPTASGSANSTVAPTATPPASPTG
jgi:uncharacterized membrane protein YphA (DoxX/SURF4 family)